MKHSPFIASLFIWFFVTTLVAQHPHPAWRNYTSNDGLPSSEVHYCIETSEGFMWFATDNGLSRFDGYKFKNYGIKEGLGDPVIFYMQLDTLGRLWMATMSGSLYYMEEKQIKPFELNEQLNAMVNKKWKDKKIGKPSDFYINDQNRFFLSLEGKGILEIVEDSITLHQPDLPYVERIGLEVSGRWILGTLQVRDTLMRQYNYQKYAKNGFSPPVQLKGDMVSYIENIPWRIGLPSKAWIKNLNGKTYLYTSGILHEINSGMVTWHRKISLKLGEYKRVLDAKDGRLYLSGPIGGGLFRCRSIQELVENRLEHFLPGTTPSHIYEDSKGNLWVSTTDHGLFFSANRDWEIYNQSAGLQSNLVQSIAIKNQQELFIGLRETSIYHVDRLRDTMWLLPTYTPNSDGVLYDLVYDPDQDELWGGSYGSFYFKNGQWNKVGYTYYDAAKSDSSSVNNVIGKNLILAKNGYHLWSGNSGLFGGVDIRRKKGIYYSIEKGIQERTLAVFQTAPDSIWVGNTRGLFLLKGIRDSVLHSPVPFDPLFHTRVEDMAELSDGTLVIATKGRGVLLKKGSHLRAIGVEDGLTSDMIENVYVDDRDNIWAGTLNGLNKISHFHGNNPGALRVHQYTTHNGLPSNEINKVESIDNDIWVATNNGLLHFADQDSINKRSIPPFIDRLTVNGISLDDRTYLSFHYKQNNISIDYLTINIRQDGNILYRYRLLPGQTNWTTTKSRSINFSGLGDGDYSFEVQSQNEDRMWSPTEHLAFRIHPPFWETWWFRLFVLSVLGFITYRLFKWRTHQLKEEAAVAKQLADLERSALRAQMNPHFIFNCLNSISNFINKGDKRAANHYLSTFAKLIRGILNHSRTDRISLEDELTLLKNYMKLEQLRFEQRFDYSISLGEDVEPFDIQIPPMMVQPFIENAIIHGLSKKETPGQIDLKYDRSESHLKVSITDNGIGINQSKSQKPDAIKAHKSVGMTITKQRLEMLSAKNKPGKFETEELKDPEGKVIGTRVQVWIPLV